MKSLLLTFLIAPVFLVAQTGIQFEHGLSWKQIQQKAKAENKYIFMDAFTTWCGPCRYMAATIFPQEKVGKAFNENFINVKVQLDTTAKDNEEVKKWYSDAHHILSSYNVKAFPTYLFFNPDGRLVHRAIGSSEADAFIAKAMNALRPESQYYVQLDNYRNGNKEAIFLRKLAYLSQDAFDAENTRKIANEYLTTQTDFFTPENAKFLVDFTEISRDAGFARLLANTERFDKVLGANAASNKVTQIIVKEELYSKLFGDKTKSKPDWSALTASVTKKYPRHAAGAVSTAKVMYYQTIQDWTNFQAAILPYMKQFGTNMPPDQLNEFAWTVFENCPDEACVAEALEWSRRSLADKDNALYMDTYANLLYKMGKKEEALMWEEKALMLAQDEDKAGYQETLEKMKAGEKTWKQ